MAGAGCVEVIGKPIQQEMSGGLIEEAFRRSDGLVVKQAVRNQFDECMGCKRGTSEFRIADLQYKFKNALGQKVLVQSVEGSHDVMHTLETSSVCVQYCCREGRAIDMTVSAGAQAGGPPVVRFVKSVGCPACVNVPGLHGGVDIPCCCCFLPELRAVAPSGADLGLKAQYVVGCTPCVPKVLYSEDGTPVHLLKPATCCGGCCVSCADFCAEEGGLFPFYFHDPTDGLVQGGPYGVKETPHIRKVRVDQQPCCHSASNFVIFYPTGIDARRKAGLLAAAFLLQFMVFERQQERD